ncbi:MAG: hypothetical protein E7470_00755 [Ruminococcaceae bacterium]|nr:hypothetical protein [Oscillospiraceae bacterium]
MDITLMDAGILAATGYGIVFAGLIVLMIVIILVGKAFSAKKEKKVEEPAAATVEVVPEPAEPAAPAAPGSAGQLKLYDTPPKTAAMLMAIVADKMGKPLNELRFISIKEVK